MNPIFYGKSDATFVFKSDLPLEYICQKIQLCYELPGFTFSEHSTWEYAFSAGNTVGFNITKTMRFGTIAEWMKSGPKDVNYQVILFIRHDKVSDIDYKNIIRRTHIELLNSTKGEVIQVAPSNGL